MAKVIMPRTRMGGSYPVAMPAALAPEVADVVVHEHSERVLLLEDEEQTNLVLKEYLQSLGYRVVAVSNGVEGLKEVMKSDFELVICDMMMPRLPGDMFYIAVQKTRPHLCQRFVFITGHQETPTVGSFMANSSAAVLVKPFRLHQLEVTLETVLSKFPKRPRPAAQPLRIVRMPEESEIRLEEEAPVPEVVPAEKKEAVPSMVMKALKVVGFLRGNSTEMPPPLPIPPSPRITRRIPLKTDATPAKNTRVIPTSAPAEPPRTKVTRRIGPPPLPASAQPAPAPVERPQVTRRVPTKTEEAAKVQVSRRIPAPSLEPVKPQVTRRVPAKTQEADKAQEKPQVSRRIPAPKMEPAQPQVTRRVAAKKTVDIKPQVTRRVPPATIRVSKTTLKIAAPKTGEASSGKAHKPTGTRKMEKATEKPAVTRKLTPASRKIK